MIRNHIPVHVLKSFGAFGRGETIKVLLVHVLAQIHEVLVLSNDPSHPAVGKWRRQNAEQMAKHQSVQLRGSEIVDETRLFFWNN